ncbi:MAG: hypothetical protein IT210_10395 [Armatimonadetes bacterium]|nr:hypothetical protein [Armatimonadota bacterium]
MLWTAILSMAFIGRSPKDSPAREARKLILEAREYQEKWNNFPPHPWFLRARNVLKAAGQPLPSVIAEPPGALEFPDFLSALEKLAEGVK